MGKAKRLKNKQQAQRSPGPQEAFKAVFDSKLGCWNKYPDEVFKLCIEPLLPDELAYRFNSDTMSVQEALSYVAHSKGEQLLPQNLPDSLFNPLMLYMEQQNANGLKSMRPDLRRPPQYYWVMSSLTLSLCFYHVGYCQLDAGMRPAYIEPFDLMQLIERQRMLSIFLYMEDHRRKGYIAELEPDYTVRNIFSVVERRAQVTPLGKVMLNMDEPYATIQ